MESIPAARRIAGSVTVFTYGAGTDLYPGFQSFYTFIEMTDDFCDIIPAPLGKVASFTVLPEIVGVGKTESILRITQIIEMDAIYVIFFHNLTYKTHQIFFGLRISGIEEIFPLVRYTNGGFLFGDRGITQIGNMFAVTQWNGYHPGMAFHTAFMTFLYGKSQWVISRVATCFPG